MGSKVRKAEDLACEPGDTHAVCLGNSSDVMRRGDSTDNGGLLLIIGQALSCEICAATL